MFVVSLLKMLEAARELVCNQQNPYLPTVLVVMDTGHMGGHPICTAGNQLRLWCRRVHAVHVLSKKTDPTAPHPEKH